MDKNNPACYECPKGKAGIHYWKRKPNGTAICQHCNLKLTAAQAQDVFMDCQFED